uniref:Uncharacterized protein n=1 Tax=Pseudomonas phage HRDY3 TaxID=3236930 RepID=A0AB39CEI9_9VIRU
MNEYIVLFADEEHAERAGLHARYLTAVNQLQAVRLVLPFLPWGVIRESVSYAHLVGNHYEHKAVSSEHSRSFLHSVTRAAADLNLIPVQINQW